jgi:hypothetical protein
MELLVLQKKDITLTPSTDGDADIRFEGVVVAYFTKGELGVELRVRKSDLERLGVTVHLV